MNRTDVQDANDFREAIFGIVNYMAFAREEEVTLTEPIEVNWGLKGTGNHEGTRLVVPTITLTNVDEKKKNITHIKLNREYCGIKGSKEVISFIDKFLSHQNTDEAEATLKYQFTAGYCYYFAVILKTAFNRGEVCWCCPYSHICWVDIDGIPYDIYGICTSEADYYIPVSYLGEALNDFTHTDLVFNASKIDLENIIKEYLKDIKPEDLSSLESIINKFRKEN